MQGFNIFGWEVNTNYTEKLSQFICDLEYENIPEEVIERAKLCVLHSLGCSLAAAPMTRTKSAENIAREVSNSGPATCWTTGEKMSPLAACIVNGAANDMLDWEDCTYTGHPSYALVPAAAALSEQLKASGKDFLTAYVTGFEVYQRASLSVGHPGKIHHVKYGHGLPNWSIFAALGAACKLYKLDAEKCNQAFGMAAMLHCISSSGCQATLSDSYHMQAGFIAQSGVQAAMYAREGIGNLKDAFDIPYMFCEQLTTDPQREWLDKELGERFMLMEMLIKHWPANMWLQNPIEAVLDIMKNHEINVDEIEEVIVDPPMEFRMHHRPEGYESLLDAEFSTPYVMAVAMLNPVPDWNWFSEENMKNPRVLELAGKVKSGPSETLTLLGAFDTYLGSDGTDFPTRTITVKMKDGKMYEESVKFPKGHPMNMLTREEFHELFLHQASYCISKEKAEGLFEFIMNLEKQPDFSKIEVFFQKEENQ